ncbi:queuosine precursor transporter [Desmospora profundinema]|uniref:Probable queuosine precursor transporter n=1 Tax=Desmospora profundinema TaxID=1571184 RepID=A0ABU1IKP1_9BACL|nr:queuosine precursor transporter [Desmospora profundinema]MDR6224973.1 putative integral membrane protein (TIGR00697 family) [Desmospora profundinema]
MQLTRLSLDDRWFILLTGCFSGMLIIANVLAVKIIQIPLGNGALFFPAAVLVYALTFAITDAVSEIWGRERTQWLVLVGFITSLLAAVMVQLAIAFPSAPFWQGQEAYAAVLGSNLRVTVAGLAAYLISQYHDIWAFQFWKRLTGARHLWLRNNLSTAVSQLLDTAVFITLAFYGSVPDLWGMILAQYVVKLIIAAFDTPLVYGLVWLIRRGCGMGEPLPADRTIKGGIEHG